MTGGNRSRDLEVLRRLAEKCGADDAVVVDASEIPVDPRVRLKCLIPACYSGGTCNYCPPSGYSLSEIKEILARHTRGILFRVLIRSSVIAAEDVGHDLRKGVFDNAGNLTTLAAYFLLVFTIASRVEDGARQMGFDSPFRLAAGTCRDAFCHFQLTCQKLMTGRGCRHPRVSAPSLEACGIDALTLAARVGWDIFPIGGSLMPKDVPHGTAMGLVLV